MSDRFETYPELTESGDDLFCEIPAQWDRLRIKQLFQIRKDIAGRLGYPVWSVTQYGLREKDITSGEGQLSMDYSKYQMLRVGDLVMNHMDLITGGVDIGWKEGVTSPDYRVFIPRLNAGVNKQYFVWMFRLCYWTKKFYSLGQGSAHLGRWRLPTRAFESIIVPVPTLKEQQQIAAFLDYETAKIDALIEKQQQLIALLGEKRQAVISHAVTKGLNPDAPMRDSGVEWLGQVPEHWEMTWLKHTLAKQPNAFVDGPFGSNLKSEHFVEDGTVFVVESGFATSGRLVEENLKRISEKHFATISRSEACAGDIIIAKIGARYGMSSILPRLSFKAVVSGNSLKLTVDAETMNVDYSHAFLQVLKSCAAMDDGVNVTAQPALSLGGLKNLLFLRPPLDEQAAIVTELNVRRNKLDALISAAFAMSELLQERRSALISAAVTGKIDVRGWKPPSSAARLETEMEVA